MVYFVKISKRKWKSSPTTSEKIWQMRNSDSPHNFDCTKTSKFWKNYVNDASHATEKNETKIQCATVWKLKVPKLFSQSGQYYWILCLAKKSTFEATKYLRKKSLFVVLFQNRERDKLAGKPLYFSFLLWVS